MSKQTVLVVDDELDIVDVVKYNLSKEGYLVYGASSGDEGLRLARSLHPSVLILDLMLPVIEGLDICRLLKNDEVFKDIFILILTAKGEEEDIVRGLELGADDYLVKPFSPKVLSARVKNLLRRKHMPLTDESEKLEISGLTIDPRRHEVLIDGTIVELTSTEFKILQLLVRKAGWVFTRYQIVDQVHGEDYPVTDRSVDVQIVGLRRKLGRFGSRIETVRGVGYRFKEEERSKEDEKAS
jgi:two-component system, OmpR family, alkaline phosphatase synthesis response regulator PhoP